MKRAATSINLQVERKWGTDHAEHTCTIVEKRKKDKERIRTDALLRETSTNYIRLIGDADRKARIMLVVNSVFLTIGITLLTKSMDDMPFVWISATILMLSNVLTLFSQFNR